MDELAFRKLEILLQGSHTYVERYKQKLDSIRKNLWIDLNLVPKLSHQEQQLVVSYFLELACQSQNSLNIDFGRASLMALPKDWLLENIEGVFEPILQTNDEWEYRRLLEICWKIDRELVNKLVIWGLKNTNPQIEDAAKECLNELGK
ncbi:MAG: hypothetical protein GY805_34520 [Chloroflexi bacterium]|nr:hypothetical protein [Chloroflexota bacterium]